MESRRREIVRAVRKGRSLRSVAKAFGVSLAAVQRWVRRAAGRRTPTQSQNVSPPTARGRIPFTRDSSVPGTSPIFPGALTATASAVLPSTVRPPSARPVRAARRYCHSPARLRPPIFAFEATAHSPGFCQSRWRSRSG
ncbi:MAG: helix-turn-helix domain-containing protein, partial [Planctomycetaceae bacterium]